MLEVSGITQIFGGVTALEDVSFSINKGEITGVIGPNGAGKTTLFNIITGIYTQTAGRVSLNDSDVSGLPPEKLARLGMVRTFQNLRLFGGMTVLENVMVGLHTRLEASMFSIVARNRAFGRNEQIARDRASARLEVLGHGLVDRRDDLAPTLTYADRRRVEIARAVIS